MSIPLFIVSLVIGVFTPSSEIATGMIVAKYVTYENAELTVDAIKSIIDYLVQAIVALQ